MLEFASGDFGDVINESVGSGDEFVGCVECLGGDRVVVLDGSADVSSLKIFKTSCDGGGLCFDVDLSRRKLGVKTMDPAKDSPFAAGDPVKSSGGERGVDGSSILDDGANERVVSMKKSFGAAAAEAAAEEIEKIGTIAGFFECFIEVGS